MVYHNVFFIHGTVLRLTRSIHPGTALEIFITTPTLSSRSKPLFSRILETVKRFRVLFEKSYCVFNGLLWSGYIPCLFISSADVVPYLVIAHVFSHSMTTNKISDMLLYFLFAYSSSQILFYCSLTPTSKVLATCLE